MSIFSKLSRAKRAAKSHKEAQQAPAEEVDKPVPYKHVVTHAAIDALSGAPSTWREADRAAIKATNEKRKSQISRNSSGMSSTLPRNSSYGSTSNYSYSRPMALRENRRSYGANGGYYTNSSLTVGNPTYQSSPLASNGQSPTQSVNEEEEEGSSSGSSSHVVEMPYAAPAPQRRESNLLETLHNNPTRKLGEAPVWASPPPTIAKPATVAPTPVQTKKRSWGFGKRNSQAAAVAVH